MAGYSPLYIKGMETGLVQSRQEFILPDDAYPTLENAFVWRERIKRKQGYEILGRLRRDISGILVNFSGSPFNFNLYTRLTVPITGEPNAQIIPGTVILTFNTVIFTDQGDGTFTANTAGNSGTINYATGDISLIKTTGGGVIPTAVFSYYPGLPVMGLRQEELNTTNAERLIAFDTVYAYKFVAGSWQEFIPGTVWTGTNYQFFWSTNYWVGDGNQKIFWVTNFSGTLGDPIRYTNGTTWANFAPITSSALGVDTRLEQCLVMLPFRSRMVVGNTLEGQSLATSVAFPNRIRWSAIGNPFSEVSAVVSVVNANAWRDDIRGQGGYLDIPTSEDIISFGYVRDNLVVYCERSTWQLRYTGRSIAPFQIERVDSELGAESTFSTVQFDTSLVGVGDKGVVKCDSFSSQRIDIKIPNLVFEFNNKNFGTTRVHGVRDFVQMLAYWTYPFEPEELPYELTFPNRRLVYNYENESWAIFTDSLTTFGTFQAEDSPKWSDFPPKNPGNKWQSLNITWFSRQALEPSIVGGNQQGYVLLLDKQTSNDVSIMVNDVTGGGSTVVITSRNHNLITGQVIQLIGFLAPDPFISLEEGIFGVEVIDIDTFNIFTYSTTTLKFDDPVVSSVGVYLGNAQISIRDGFSVISKKFNFLDDGQNIQLGFLDVLMDNTENGAVTLNVYLDYNDSTPVNTLPENQIADLLPIVPDTFFNTVVPTTRANVNGLQSSKNWQRVFCPARGAFITLEWTLSNAQLNGEEQETDVQIDAQILYIRKAGRQLPIGV